MTDEPSLRSLDDLRDAMSESVGGKCDRCRREPATLRLRISLLPPQRGRSPVAAAAAAKANVCEPCGVAVFAVVARAVGQVA